MFVQAMQPTDLNKKTDVPGSVDDLHFDTLGFMVDCVVAFQLLVWHGMDRRPWYLQCADLVGANGQWQAVNTKYKVSYSFAGGPIFNSTTNYQHPMLFINTLAVFVMVVAKFPNIHRARIFYQL